MKHRPYIISILLTIALTVSGLYLPSIAFSRQNRRSLTTPGAYGISSANLYYSVSFATMMRVFYLNNYTVVNYDSAEAFHLRQTEDEIRSQLESFLSQFFELFTVRIPSDKVSKNTDITPCMISQKAADTDSLRPNIVYDIDSTYAASSSGSTTSDAYGVPEIYDDAFSDDISFFAWKCQASYSDMEMTFYLDDNYGKVVAFEIKNPMSNYIKHTVSLIDYFVYKVLSFHYDLEVFECYVINYDYDKKPFIPSSFLCLFADNDDNVDKLSDSTDDVVDHQSQDIPCIVTFSNERISLNMGF